MAELITFKRGADAADVKKILNIGEIEGLRLKLKSLEKHPAVNWIRTTFIRNRKLDGYEKKGVRVLQLQIDFRRNKEKYEHIDEFLVPYLDPRFFSGANIDDNSKIEGISSDLGDLRRTPTFFNITLYIHPNYVKDFPEVDYNRLY